MKVQAKAQKEKDEAEVQVNLYTMEASKAETREARGQGRWHELLNCLLSRTCLSGSGMSMAVLIPSTTSGRLTLFTWKLSLLLLCPGPMTFWASSLPRCG